MSRVHQLDSVPGLICHLNLVRSLLGAWVIRQLKRSY
jgi:hypothetical protein